MEANHFQQWLSSTNLLDFKHDSIQDLVQGRGWLNRPTPSSQIGAVYTFVRDEITYAYNEHPMIPASKVLAEKEGNCLSKGILLMALLRSLRIPCRLQANQIDKSVYQGLLKGISYSLCPEELFHCSIEVFFSRRWLRLEGYILDLPYIQHLQALFPDYMGSFYGYGAATLNFRNPPIEWIEQCTAIQESAVLANLGQFSDPDSFFEEYPEAEKWSQGFYYTRIFRPRMNKAIRKVRGNS